MPQTYEPTETPDTLNIQEPGKYITKTDLYAVSFGKSYGDFKELKKNSFIIKNWKATHMNIKDSSSAVIEDSTVDELNVRGFCFLKNCKIHRLHVGMFGNCFIQENCEIYELDIAGTVHLISMASKVQHIRLHKGGRVCLLTRDYQLGRPKQPDNLLLDGDREWSWLLLTVAKDPHLMEYWAFG